jgi:hypothetical protein
VKKIILTAFLFLGANAFGQANLKTAKNPAEFVPAGYVVHSEIQGDLNKDNQLDYVFIIKSTDKNNFIKDEYRGELDRNPRGIIIAIKNNDSYDLVIENRSCFSSENEDGGVYYPPELDVSIDKGNLLFHYAHGRYGYWRYKFQYRNQDFELIGYDSSSNHGPVVEREISINFITKKEKIRNNTNQDSSGGDEKFKETWKAFTLPKPISLREISDFDSFDVESTLVPIQ